MLYLIGLGLNEKGISQEGKEAVKKCTKVYLEKYTVDFPYTTEELEKTIGKNIIPAGREFIEQKSKELVEEAKKENIALLVYGSPLTATTHIALIKEARKNKTECKIIYSASIFDAVAETGLQLYKFGKITSMPKWQAERGYKPDSFIEIVKENQSINAHSLILIDIGLKLKDALAQLETSSKKHKFPLKKIVVCSKLTNKDKKIVYDSMNNLRDKKIEAPYCIILPGKLHFVEESFLNDLD